MISEAWDVMGHADVTSIQQDCDKDPLLAQNQRILSIQFQQHIHTFM